MNNNGKRRRVVVTGIGVVSPLGFGDAEFWEGMAGGESSAAVIRAFDISEYRSKVGCEVSSERIQSALAAEDVRASDRAGDMAIVAAGQALRQAGLVPEKGVCEPRPVHTIVGSGAGSSHSMYECFQSFAQKGLKGVRPTSVPRCMTNAMSARISMRYRLTGSNYVVVAACTGSTIAIGTGLRMIRHGYGDVVLCGGADAPFDPFVYGGWNNLGVMSVNSDGRRACRPFDRNRDGCVLGEGAAMMVLEDAGRAMARGARIRGEILGYGETSDADKMTAPNVEGQAAAMRLALDDAGVRAEDLAFVSAHGTGTRANDVCESASIRKALGAAAGEIPVVSTKSYFGHALGAAGVMEAVPALLALESGSLPPNLNLDEVDPECGGLRFPVETVKTSKRAAMKNSFGFGGSNGVLILGVWDGGSSESVDV
jgi:3-oxoacyl-[acyl-carrier-protein] synthase II